MRGDGRPSSWPDSPEAEEAFVEFLARREDGERVDFEAFCRERPGLEEPLRSLYRLHSRVEPFLHEEGNGDGEDGVAEPGDERPTDPRFEVLEELGRGGMGVVYRVVDRSLDRVLAMKVVRNVEGPDPGQAQRSTMRRLSRFLEEAEITGRMGHPGIVPIHERGMDEAGRVFFTMPLVEGHDLQRIIALLQGGEEGWSRARALEVLLKVCDTMAFAHDRGVLHRDLKPSNVMVGRFGEVYVMDWGLARVFDRAQLLGALELDADSEQEEEEAPALTLEGDVVGTPTYMAPEQAAGDLDALGPPSDVYAVGALLYHVLALEAPYDRDAEGDPPSSRAVLSCVLAGPPRPLERLRSDLPPDLVAICERAMERDPARRYADMGAMASDLRAYLDGRVVSAYESGGWAELRKWVTRNRGLAASLGLVVFLLVGGLALVTVLESARRTQERLAGDRFLMDAYLAEAEGLWPAVPERVDAYLDWLERARAITSRLDAHEERFSDLLAGGAQDPGAREELVRFRDALRAFVDPDPTVGAIADVEARLAFARGLRAASVDAHAAAWDETIRAYEASYPLAAEHPLVPQVGLVPLGADPESGLLEFGHLATGEPPTRDEAGRLTIGPDSSVVLVLLPAGGFDMGAELPDDEHPLGSANRSLDVRSFEKPIHAVGLGPYFLAKHELTRAQWWRATHADPSSFASGPAESSLAPVETVSWFECDEFLRRLDLELPTEAQWEYAARAGSDAPWWWGNAPDEIAERIHVSDGDGPVPIGTHAPNPFGLTEVLGNVSEWCLEPLAAYGEPWRGAATEPWPLDPLTGERLAPVGRERIYRGANFGISDGGDPTKRNVVGHSRVSARFLAQAGVARDTIGVRAARALQSP